MLMSGSTIISSTKCDEIREWGRALSCDTHMHQNCRKWVGLNKQKQTVTLKKQCNWYGQEQAAPIGSRKHLELEFRMGN